MLIAVAVYAFRYPDIDERLSLFARTADESGRKGHGGLRL
jgi:hypothetical protein